jgi:hypothetical protein
MVAARASSPLCSWVRLWHSFVFTIGEGRTLINGLADFGRDPHWKYQTVFAPHIAHLPTMQQPNREPNVEAIMLSRPDVVLTMHRASVDILEHQGIRTVFLAWREPEDVKGYITLLGEAFHKPTVADRYRRYFDKAVGRERVYVAPVGAHTWAHRTAEQPLTVLSGSRMWTSRPKRRRFTGTSSVMSSLRPR